MMCERNEEIEETAVWPRIRRCIRSALKPAWRSAVWLLSIMLPISLAVRLLKYAGVLDRIAAIFEPLFLLFGLPGESVLVYITSCLINIYSAIAVIGMLSLDMRAVTILALMCLIAHNLPVEATVQKRTGSSALQMVLIRIGVSLAAGFAMNRILPVSVGAVTAVTPAGAGSAASLAGVIMSWLGGASVLTVKVIVIVCLLMILDRILREFGVMRMLSRLLLPFLRVMGLPRDTAFMWIAANTVGLAYGSAILVDGVEAHGVSRKDADILNHHIAISHALLEDTLLFVAIGVSAFWITVPRLAAATLVVWGRRAWLACSGRAALSVREGPGEP